MFEDTISKKIIHRILQNYLKIYKRPVYRLYKELLQINNKKTTNLKIGKGSEEPFLKRKYTNGQ